MTDRDLQEAIRLHREGRLEPALAIYEQLIDEQAPDARLLSLVGQVQLQLGDTDAGVDTLTRSAELAPDDVRIVLALVRGLASAGRCKEASSKAQHLLERDGSNAQVWAAMAAVQRHLGQHRVELKALQRAVSLAPDDIPILIALANAQTTNGSIGNAIDTLKRAAALAPDNARVRNNLGALHLRLNEPQNAVDALRDALQIQPAYPTAAVNLAIALHRTGQLDAAREAAERAVELNPGAAEPRAELASILTDMGNLTGAEAAFQAALQTAPGDQRLLAGLAQLRDRQGRTADGLALLTENIDPGKTLPDTRLVAAGLARRMGRREMALQYLRPLQDSTGDPLPNLELPQRRRLCFLLGDIYDGSADFGAALRYYDKANACAQASFDADAFYHHVDRIINLHTAAPTPSSTPRTPRRVFIVGMPRSGTHLVETMLSRHPDVRACGALPLLGSLLRQHGYPETSLAGSEGQQVADLYCSATTAPAQTKIVTDAMPLNFLYLGVLAQFMPDALIIHCRRDPRDTLLSCYFQNFAEREAGYSFSFEDLSHYWRNYDRLMRHWREVLPEMIRSVQYEDLVSDPGFVMQPLLEHLDLQWDDSVLETDDGTTSPHQAAIHQRSVGRFARYRPFLGDRAELFDALT